MEQHPIPQNVTSFQFKLIGDMTLKQFGYLALGVGLAYIMFVFLSSSNPIIAWPIIVISTLLGVAFAFLPISDRPLDHWVKAFFKAVYSPTKSIWQKGNLTYQNYTSFTSRYGLFLSALSPTRLALAATSPTPQPKLTPTQPVIPQPQPQEQPKQEPTKEDLGKTVDLARQAQEIKMKIIEAERRLSQIKSTQATQQSSQEYIQKANEALSNLQRLITEGSQIQQQLTKVSPEIKTNQVETHREPVKVSTKSLPKQTQTQLTLTTFPNVINGIVLDAAGNYLEGVVVVIYDKEGLPVRALKTNKLGQFTGSTPLQNGTYTIEVEKDNLVFDVLQIELNNQVLPPLTIKAKKIVGSL